MLLLLLVRQSREDVSRRGKEASVLRERAVEDPPRSQEARLTAVERDPRGQHVRHRERLVKLCDAEQQHAVAYPAGGPGECDERAGADSPPTS